ncbi:MAG: hypothetical protein LBE22_09515, partial [Azoarcus sp.]|nr:hypothetical protein [Azoarcus sp.]
MSEANPNIQPTTKALGFAKLNPTYIQPAILYNSISRRSFRGYLQNKVHGRQDAASTGPLIIGQMKACAQPCVRARSGKGNHGGFVSLPETLRSFLPAQRPK